MDDTYIRSHKLPTIWWPDWLYESLPFIYAVAGLVAISSADTQAGYVVGGLFLLAALVILKMRNDFRKFKETISLAEYLMEHEKDSSD
jgi:hypothetical protein